MSDLYRRYDIDTSSVLHWNYRGFKEFPAEFLKECNSKVTDIYLKENSIKIFPGSLHYFKCLKNLYLCGNEIKTIPKEIGLLTTLKCLDLSGNLLISIPEQISLARNLKCLILDDNLLTELPLSMRKLKKLRYLSVCDNKLLWLPQRPVSNYYAAEFKFWRNKTLQHVSFSLWLHMLQDQQIRCLYLGCFTYPHTYPKNDKNVIRITDERFFPETEIVLPTQYQEIQKYPELSPPPLVELCMRMCYSLLANIEQDDENNNTSVNRDHVWRNYHSKKIEKYTTSPQKDTTSMLNKCGNISECASCSDTYSGSSCALIGIDPSKMYTDTFGGVLPAFLAEEIVNGPAGFCEILQCKTPLFHSIILDIINRAISTEDGTLDVLVTACFCSGKCCEKWRFAHRASPFKWLPV